MCEMEFQLNIFTSTKEKENESTESDWIPIPFIEYSITKRIALPFSSEGDSEFHSIWCYHRLFIH